MRSGVKSSGTEIWGKEVQHNEKAEWTNNIDNHTKNVKVQADITITRERLQKQLKKVPKWKTSGLDDVRGSWMRGFNSLHNTIGMHLEGCLRTGEVLLWRTKGRICLI